MATTTTIPAFLDAFREQLIARPGLLDVNVWTAEMPEPDCGPKNIQFISAEADEEWGALGACRRNDAYSVHGFIRVIVPGAGEETIKEARDEVFRIYAELDAQLMSDKRVSETVQSARVKSLSMDALATTDGRACAIVFQLEVKAQLTT